MILSQCLKQPGLPSCVGPSLCHRTFHTGPKNFNLIVGIFWQHLVLKIDIIFVVKLITSCYKFWWHLDNSFLKRLLKPEMYEEWIYYYGIEESDQVGNQSDHLWLAMIITIIIDRRLVVLTMGLIMTLTRLDQERSWGCPWTLVTPWSPWWA